jgi:hypothetical protein
MAKGPFVIDDPQALAGRLLQDYQIYIVVIPDESSGQHMDFVRLSAQIYLEKADFVRFGNLVLKLLAEGAGKASVAGGVFSVFLESMATTG